MTETNATQADGGDPLREAFDALYDFHIAVGGISLTSRNLDDDQRLIQYHELVGELLDVHGTLLDRRDAVVARAEQAEAQVAYWRGRAEYAWRDGDRLANDLVAATFGGDEDREGFRQEWARIAALGKPEVERRFVLADGRESEFDLHQEDGCGCRQETRLMYVGPWRPLKAAGLITAEQGAAIAAELMSSRGCWPFGLPSRADVEAQAQQAAVNRLDRRIGYEEVDGDDGRVILRRRDPAEVRARLVTGRDQAIADGVPAEVIDAFIADTHDGEDQP